MLFFVIELLMGLIWVVLGYLLGLVLFGILLVWVMNLGDLCKIGLGNIGVMNVLCIGNKKVVVLILLFDGVKGVVVVLLVC